MEKNKTTLSEATEQFSNLEFEESFPPEQEQQRQQQQPGQQEEQQQQQQQQQEQQENQQPPLEVDDNAFEKTNPGEEDNMYFNNVYNNFRELGILPDAAELEQGKILTNDDLLKILEDERKNAAKKMFEDMYLSKINDEDAREYLNYVMNGGSSRDFFSQRINSPVVDINGDITDGKVQDKIIRKYMDQFENMDEEEISEQIQMYENAGKKEKYARMFLDRMKKFDEAQKEELKNRAELERKQAQANYERVYNAYKTEIEATESLFGVKCDDSKKNRLMGMLFNPVKTQDDEVTTEFQIRLSNVLNNPKKALVLAELLSNDLDVSKYSKSVETEVTRKIRGGLDSKPNVKKNQTSPFDKL